MAISGLINPWITSSFQYDTATPWWWPMVGTEHGSVSNHSYRTRCIDSLVHRSSMSTYVVPCELRIQRVSLYFSTDEPGGIDRGAWLRTRQNHPELVYGRSVAGKGPHEIYICSATSGEIRTSTVRVIWKVCTFRLKSTGIYGIWIQYISIHRTRLHNPALKYQLSKYRNILWDIIGQFILIFVWQ